MKCPFCEATITTDKRFCPECGRYLSPDIRNAVAEETIPAPEPIPDMPSEDREAYSEPVSTEPDAASSEAAPADQADDQKPADNAIPYSEEPGPETESSHEPSDAPAETGNNSDKPLSVMPTDPNKPATADLMIPVEPDPQPKNDSQWATVGTWGWIGIRLLMLVPIVNIVFLLVWSFGGTKKNVKQSWARATLVWVLVLMILFFALVLYAICNPYAFSKTFGQLFKS